jgi:SNF2 family DNA or RNA helicase
MLAYDMGTGKSKCIVDAVCNIEARYTLILCPCSVVSVWPREFDKHAAVPVKVMPLVGPIKNRVCWLSTVTSQRVERLVVVLNYEALQHDDMERALRNVPWALMVADESHRIKKPGGIQSRMLARIGQAAKRRVCLTGTPMPHSPLDIYGQYRFLDKSIFGHNFTAFKAQYAVMGGYQNRCAVAFKNQDDLRAKFYSIAHRVEKRDVLDLPKFTHERLDVELSDSARRVYRQLETEFCAQLDKGEVTAANALAKLLRLQQVTSGHVPADGGPIEEVDHGKRDALLSLIDGLADTEPVVVFCRFRHDLDAVAQVCKKLGRTLYELSGRVNELEAWQSGTLGDVLAVQIQSGGVGVDLTRAAYVVYYSLGFSLGDYEQSLARVDRPGQTRPVTYYHLIATKTVDEKVYTALRERKQVVEHILSEGDYGNHRTTTPDGRVRDSRPAAEVAR